MQADLGGRLRYADAIALFETLASDTRTYLGAELSGADYPASVAEAVQIAFYGQGRVPGPFGDGRPRVTDQEKRAAETRFSGRFRG